MTPKTLRRKLRKKLKRKTYGKCPRCGGYTVRRLYDGDNGPAPWRLFRECEAVPSGFVAGRPACGWGKELFWHGRVVELEDTSGAP